MRSPLRYLLTLLSLMAASAGFAQGPDYRWRGGSGNWDGSNVWQVRNASNQWVNTSVLPGSTNNVYFENSSFPGSNPVVTINVAASAKDIIWTEGTNTPTLRVNQQLTIAGSLTLTSAMNLVFNTTTNTSTTTGSGELLFTASEPATLTTASKTITGPITFNGTGPWTLSGSLTVNSPNTNNNAPVVTLVNFVKGDVNAPSETNMLILGSHATSSLGKQDSHVVGFMQKDLRNRASYEFPLGDGTWYRPILVKSNADALTTYRSRYFPTTPNPTYPTNRFEPPLGSVSTNEYWYLEKMNTNGSSDYIVTLNFNHPVYGSSYYQAYKPWDLVVAGFKNGAWYDSNFPGRTLDPVNYTVTAGQAVNAFKYFTIGRIGPTQLPVRLVSFTSLALQGQVALKWQTASEENTSHFVVESAGPDMQFAAVGQLAAKGNSANLTSYAFTDPQPQAGKQYYRLKVVDFDGFTEYSKIILVEDDGLGGEIDVYPNPSNGQHLKVSFPANADAYQVRLYSMQGNEVGYRPVTQSGTSLALVFTRRLPRGFYLAVITNTNTGRVTSLKYAVN